MRGFNRNQLGANILAALLFNASPCTSLFVRPTAVPKLQTTHIRGFVRSYKNVAVTRADLTFRAGVFNKTISVDGEGFYDTDLPAGLFTLYVLPRTGQQLEEFHHPLVHVSSDDVTLNFYLVPPPPDCDRLGPPVGSSASRDVVICGGEDSFAVPSEDKTPFELTVRYQTRRDAEQGSRAYSSEGVPGGHEVPVFVAYNLFT